MKNLLISIVFILTFSFCQSKEKMNKISEKATIFRLSEHYSKFKFHDLKEFSDSFEFGESIKNYKQLDSLETWQILQDNKELIGDFGRFFYYATFTDSTLIALLEETSDENGAFIWLLKYDNKGKLQSHISIAGRWGDAGDAQYSYGKLLKDNTFISTLLFSSTVEEKMDTYTTVNDSIIIKFKFQANNKIKIDTLLNQSDTIVEKIKH
jgi:hypothetical protein